MMMRWEGEIDNYKQDSKNDTNVQFKKKGEIKNIVH